MAGGGSSDEGDSAVSHQILQGTSLPFWGTQQVITGNSTQLTRHALMQHIEDLGSRVCFAPVAHPWSNGQVERANAEVL